MTRHVLTTHIGGREVTLPGTIADIREALPEALRADFEREIESVSADELFGVMASWALRTPQAHDPDEDALVERLKAGDMTGMKYADELDDAYRSTG
ncbi:hypothetical protein OG948_14395 [Embleya sp. NBC_00888]|uniref:hypothetical protein n=1 Tax=Embleya sp. NBC_00888 TaxID=2975960 RepID=UPI0038640E4A|nr:hypothetical protein OG948_14395 [Embleya sp. NBC_00888]